MANPANNDFYRYYQSALSQVLAPPIESNWVTVEKEINVASKTFEEYQQFLRERGSSSCSSAYEATIVTIPEIDPTTQAMELSKQLIVRLMDSHPYLKTLLQECVERKGEIRLTQLREKLIEYEHSEHGYVLMGEGDEASQVVLPEDHTSEFIELFQALEGVEKEFGKEAVISLPHDVAPRPVWEGFVISFEDVKRYYRYFARSPLLTRENLQMIYTIYKAAYPVGKVVGTCVSLYVAPWTTTFYLIAKFGFKLLK